MVRSIDIYLTETAIASPEVYHSMLLLESPAAFLRKKGISLQGTFPKHTYKALTAFLRRQLIDAAFHSKLHFIRNLLSLFITLIDSPCLKFTDQSFSCR